MVYTILISVVFIAELIIFFAIMQKLFQADKWILNINKKIIEAKSVIKDISVLVRKISEQWIVLANDFVETIKRESEELFLQQLSKLLIAIFVINLNFKFAKELKKSKMAKNLIKGFSLLENMV